MPITSTHTLTFGTTLVRHYNSGDNVDTKCGTVSYFQALEDQLRDQAWEYYDVKSSGGAVLYNKFFGHMTWNIYDPAIPLPNPIAKAYCHSADSSGEIHIHMEYFGPTYRTVGALSHEVGHANHFWTQILDHSTLLPFRHLWEKQVSSNGTLYDPSAKPWKEPYGVGSGVETAKEQFANAHRYFFGIAATRGVSGPGTTDPVVPGFENPASRPEWKKQMLLMPETCAFALKFGVKSGSLSWQGGTTGYWQFQRTDNVWVAQTDYFTWFEYKHVNGSWTWVRYPAGQPVYTLT